MGWLSWLFLLILLAAASAGAFWAYRVYLVGDASFNFSGLLFRPRPEPRLGVTEHATIDSRRKLLLVRRDDVEHLIMTGGPVDVVIETGIVQPRAQEASAARPAAEQSTPVFTRQPRNFGQAVNE